MPIDPNSHVPIYEQIGGHIFGAVAAGVYRPGEVLPSIRALAIELKVNPNTVQRAYQELERQGMVCSRRGVGIIVAPDGQAAARSRSETVVRTRFREGVDLGRTARLSTEQVQSIFRDELDRDGSDAAGKSGPTPAANGEDE